MQRVAPRPVESARTRQTDQAYERIKRMIIELELVPGSQFTEAQLAARGGTSKTPVREALVRLQRDGLVQAMPRSGYRVVPVTLKDARDLCEFRTLLECEAAERAADRGVPDAVLEWLQHLLEELHTDYYLDPGTVGEYMRAGFEFDVTIAEYSGNERLAAALARVFDELWRVLRLAMRVIP